MAGQTAVPYPKHSVSELGKYRIIKNIAEGTFAKVKMAEHIITGQIVAMKFLSKKVINSSGTRSRVLREVQYMRTLKHPHIVKLYEVISTPTHIIIVLEYVGGELFNYIVRFGQMPEPQARRFFQQLISGIDYSHRLRIVHRDLKPENILLDDRLNVKIADFGLSNVLRDGEFLVTSCGSPNYAAPEVINGFRYSGPEIDVWSCGVILYVMLCGRLPFEDDDVKVLFNKIASGTYYSPSHLSPEAKLLLSRMLTVDPVKRITIPEILESPFFKTDLPRYLMPALLPPSIPIIGSLDSLVHLPESVQGLGLVEDDLVKEIADSMEGVSVEDVLTALRIDEGLKGNAVKVAYQLLRDKRRSGKTFLYENEGRDAHLAALATAVNDGSPIMSFSRDTAKKKHFPDCFYDDDESSDELPQASDPYTRNISHSHTFAILESSLPEISQNDNKPQRSNTSSSRSRHKKLQWQCGIRSRSSKTEIMLELYKTLKLLGMEWKEKPFLGGLGGIRTPLETENLKHKRHPVDNDDKANWPPPEFDAKNAASIYRIETRVRCGDVVVLMDLQLYQVDEETYIVDFKHQGYYNASKEPGASKFERAVSASSSSHNNTVGERRGYEDEDVIVSPFLFMDTACRLILLLAGEADSASANQDD